MANEAVQSATDRAEALRTLSDNPQLMRLLTEDAPRATLAISGAEKSAFNGVVRETPPDQPGWTWYGVAQWDGSLLLNNKLIIQPLQEMYANPGKQHDEKTLLRMRRALATLLHENAHLLMDRADDRADSRLVDGRTWIRFAEEGFTNAWSGRHLNDFIRELGIDKIAPGITEVQHVPTYPAYTPAAAALGDGLQQLTATDALTLINNEPSHLQWDRITDLLYDSSDLPRLVPEHDVFHAKHSIEVAMRTTFAWLDENTGRGDAAQVRELSALRGQQVLQAGVWQVKQLEGRYGGPDARELYRAALAANRGIASPAPRRTGSSEGPAAASGGSVARDGGPAGRTTPAADQGYRGRRAGRGERPVD